MAPPAHVRWPRASGSMIASCRHSCRPSCESSTQPASSLSSSPPGTSRRSALLSARPRAGPRAHQVHADHAATPTPAAWFWLITRPAATVALDCCVTAPTTSPAPVIAVLAAACASFTTFGTVTGPVVTSHRVNRASAVPCQFVRDQCVCACSSSRDVAMRSPRCVVVAFSRGVPISRLSLRAQPHSSRCFRSSQAPPRRSRTAECRCCSPYR